MGARLPLHRRAYVTALSLTLQRRERRMPFSRREVLEAHQRRRLRGIVAHAYQHVPYYRERMRTLGLTPADFSGARDLSKLPVIEREQLQRDPEYFMSEERVDDECVVISSGGSTSMPVTVLVGPLDLVRKEASVARFQPLIVALSGRRWRRRMARIAPPAASGVLLEAAHRRNLIRPPALGRVVIDLSLQRTTPELIAAIDRFRPHLIVGYGSVLEELFAHAVRSGEPFHRPRVVFYGADSLSPQARALISDRLGIEVLSVYQTIESPQVGFECERHSGYHLNVDLCPVRIVDEEGRALPPGEAGEVVISNLVNHTTVLLNYRLGDVATLTGEPCGCGRTLPMMSFIDGRTQDSGMGADGRPIHVQLLVRPFTLDHEIWGFRIEQRGRGRFHAQVLAAPEADEHSLTARVRDRFERIVGPEESVTLELVEALSRTPGGKVRRVASETVAP